MIDVVDDIGVDDRCSKMFVGIVLVSPHETITRPLGSPRGLKLVPRAKCHRESYESGGSLGVVSRLVRMNKFY